MIHRNWSSCFSAIIITIRKIISVQNDEKNGERATNNIWTHNHTHTHKYKQTTIQSTHTHTHKVHIIHLRRSPLLKIYKAKQNVSRTHTHTPTRRRKWKWIVRQLGIDPDFCNPFIHAYIVRKNAKHLEKDLYELFLFENEKQTNTFFVSIFIDVWTKCYR